MRFFHFSPQKSPHNKTRYIPGSGQLAVLDGFSAFIFITSGIFYRHLESRMSQKILHGPWALCFLHVCCEFMPQHIRRFLRRIKKFCVFQKKIIIVMKLRLLFLKMEHNRYIYIFAVVLNDFKISEEDTLQSNTIQTTSELS